MIGFGGGVVEVSVILEAFDDEFGCGKFKS